MSPALNNSVGVDLTKMLVRRDMNEGHKILTLIILSVTKHILVMGIALRS